MEFTIVNPEHSCRANSNGASNTKVMGSCTPWLKVSCICISTNAL